MANPLHIAIIMDGNGRWAKQRGRPRVFGHKRGVEATKRVIELAAQHKIPALSLFAFSSENWQRPKDEVNFLMDLFHRTLSDVVAKMHEYQVRVRFVGDVTKFKPALREQFKNIESNTSHNTALNLNIAVNYGGKLDIAMAVKEAAANHADFSTVDSTERAIESHLSLNDLPPVDLLVRTGGEYRISNFFLWQAAYAELYFTDVKWPDFSDADFEAALHFYESRERRFGKVLDQSSVPTE